MMWSSTATPSNRPDNCGPASLSGSGLGGLELHPDKTKIVYCKDTNRRDEAAAHQLRLSRLHLPGSPGPWPTRLLCELLTSHEPQGEAGDRRTDQGLAPQPSQCNGPRRTRRGHQRPDPRLVQLLRGLLPLRVVFHRRRASTNILSDGRCRSSNDCEANPPKHGDGSTLPVSASHNSSLTGTSSPQPHAELREPYDGRLSRTVLREREGEVPSRHSPRSEMCSDLGFCFSGWGDLNSRPSVPQLRKGRFSQYQRAPKSASEVGFYKFAVTSRTCR